MLTHTEYHSQADTYTVNEVKAFLAVSESTVYGILRANIFPHGFSGGQCTIPKKSFDEWFYAFRRDMEECHSCE